MPSHMSQGHTRYESALKAVEESKSVEDPALKVEQVSGGSKKAASGAGGEAAAKDPRLLSQQVL